MSLSTDELSIPELETERLRLRAFRPTDLDAFARLRADPEVMRYIGTGTPHTREQSLERMQANIARWRTNGFGHWAVVEKSSGELMGWCGLARLDETPEVEVGYGLARRFWGAGAATEAARASLRFGFEQLGLERIAAVAFPENTASRRVMEKLGMTYLRRAHYYGAELVYYALTRSRFRHADAPYVLHKHGKMK
ncbi:MAG TPA: GNAT family N-acetyltransferase [Pyrinomonadaceae bacterium]|nr:GNAT family N-acetyltransferase [Pyrinomonadaceae bacterium]